MDNLILEALAAELRPRLIGWPVFRVSSPGPDLFILAFDDPGRSRLLLGTAPVLTRLHLIFKPSPREAGFLPPFQGIASHHLTGAILAGIEKEPRERVVRLRFEGASGPGKSLVAELIGRSSNLLVLDAQDTILGFSRRIRSEFRRPVAGDRYEPPRPRARRPPPSEVAPDGGSRLDLRSTPGKLTRDPDVHLDPRDLSRALVEELARRSQLESHPLSDLVLEFCPSIGSLAAREIEHRALAGENAFDVLSQWVNRVFGTLEESLEAGVASGRAPLGFIYSDRPPEGLDRRRPPGPGRFLLSPLTLASAASDLELHTYPSLNEAAEAYYGALASGAAFRAWRDGLLGIARREADRSGQIAIKVSRDLEAMQGADRYRIYGESLLAGLTRAERRHEAVIVPDPYGEEGMKITIPIDPAVPLQRNAERYFAKHRKAERGRAVAAARREEQQRRSEQMRALAERISTATEDEELRHAEEELRGHGIAVGLEKRRRRPALPAAPVVEGVRLYRSSEGYEILVGKGSNENDRLTFKIASPEDVWLHASGAPGAHVIVRNPRSEPRLPAATLREAAELAAFFSRAKEEGRADVLVARRKHVRRVRGASRGTVTVKKHETMFVTPRNPFE